MNIGKMMPSFLKELDSFLLTHFPRLWVTKAHVVVPCGLLAVAAAWLAGRFYPATVAQHDFYNRDGNQLAMAAELPNPEDSYGVVLIIAASVACYWMYLQIRDRGVYYVNERGGEPRRALLYIGILTLFAAIPASFATGLEARAMELLESHGKVVMGWHDIQQPDDIRAFLSDRDVIAANAVCIVGFAMVMRAWQIVRFPALAAAAITAVGVIVLLGLTMSNERSVLFWATLLAYVLVTAGHFAVLRCRTVGKWNRFVAALYLVGIPVLPILFFNARWTLSEGGAAQAVWGFLFVDYDYAAAVRLACFTVLFTLAVLAISQRSLIRLRSLPA